MTLLVGVLAVFSMTAVSAADIERETLKRLGQLRAMKADVDAKAIERYNTQMDEMWRFFDANKPLALPVLRRELAREITEARPNNLLLLDTGYFVRLQDSPADKQLAKEALLKLDPTDKTVRQNQQQLFFFAHNVAADRDPRTLAFLDKAFLRNPVTAFIPQHVLTLDETLVCVFLYGVYGDGAETHLKSLVGDPAVADKVIEILTWIGTPDSMSEVTVAMNTSRTYETFVRGTTFMMDVGGPNGRATMLAINPDDFDAKAQEYYAQIKPSIESTNYDALKKALMSQPDVARVSDNELKRRLGAMYANYGRDTSTSPADIFNSTLPNTYLVGELSRIRTRMFYRLSDEALDDVQVTNAILNTLRYRAN